MATPARLEYLYTVQDDRGFRSRVRFVGFTPDITADAATIMGQASHAAAIGTALQAMTNAKVVDTGFAFTFDIAQEPSTETGVYQLVQQGAILEFGDGTINKERVTIPAPVDALFLTSSQDNLIVVDPTASVLTALQGATSGGALPTPGGGNWGAQFFGGQLRLGKPRRRRVLQGA